MHRVRWVYPRAISLALTILLGACGSEGTAQQSLRTNEKSHIAESATEIVRAIKQVVDHDNLSDYSFFQKSLGVVVKEFPPIRSHVSFEACGFTYPPLPLATVQQSIYAVSPWFLDDKKGGRPPCSFALVKKIERGNVESVLGRLELNTNKVCVTSDDIKSEFPTAINDSRLAGWVFDLVYFAGNNIKLNFISATNDSFKNCLAEIVFFQKFN